VPIPSDLIERPEVVWAAPDDTLGQVRDRLESSEIENKWRAFVLIRSADGRYAVTSVFELQPLVWAEGPLALQRPLRDLALPPLQPGLEQATADLQEAQHLADQYQGWLVVLRDGKYAGLLEGKGRAQSNQSRPVDAFDLFDELLPESTLAETEFIIATPNSTVTQVARELHSKRDPENAYLIVCGAGGSFQVMAARDLDRELERMGAEGWALPLGRFASHLRSAETREPGTVGRRQAQAIADRRNYLILTEQGRPLGLVPGRIIWRTPGHPLPASARGTGAAPYSLFDAPLDLLDGITPSGPGLPGPRHVNLWFEDTDRQPIARSQSLVLGRSYHLALNIGQLLKELSIIDWNGMPEGPQAIVEPQTRDACLYASLFSQDFAIPEPTVAFRLPREGNTDTVRMRIEPLQRSRSEEPATLELCLYYRTYLVQTFVIHVEVVAADEATTGQQPQAAVLTHARTTRFPEMEQLPPDELSLTITRDGTDRYRFTFLVDPDLSDGAPTGRSVTLSCYVRLTRDDLTHLITKARRQLHHVVRAFDLLQNGNSQIYEKATRALAQVGRQLYLKLFETTAGQALAEWMAESLAPGSTIQIVDLAGEFVFPWSLVYTAWPWDDDQPVDVAQFWGGRYRLVTLTRTLLDTYRQSPVQIDTGEPLHFCAGIYERLLGAAEQKAFFTGLASGSQGRVIAEILNSRREMSQALAAADRDLYYFFCHGYTERIATDIQLDTDLVGLFVQQAFSNAAVKPESLADHLEDLFDVSDSWLRLTQGKILLSMLKETVPSQLTRHPIVFLNMCQSAQVLPSLSDGFVPFFIQRGARAVIGTECSMHTGFADEFARAFLTRFLQGQPVGQILLSLRQEYLAQGNPLALAYTLYADADLRLQEPLWREGAPVPERQPQEAVPEDAARQAAVEELWENDMDGLMLALASRVRAQEAGVGLAELQQWLPPEEAFAADLEASPEWTQALIAFGKRWWDKLGPQLHDLLCNENHGEHKALMNALSTGVKMLAVALAPVLIAELSTLPAVAIVVATIVAKQIADAGIEAACELWSQKLAKGEEAGPQSEGKDQA